MLVRTAQAQPQASHRALPGEVEGNRDWLARAEAEVVTEARGEAVARRVVPLVSVAAAEGEADSVPMPTAARYQAQSAVRYWYWYCCQEVLVAREEGEQSPVAEVLGRALAVVDREGLREAEGDREAEGEPLEDLDASGVPLEDVEGSGERVGCGAAGGTARRASRHRRARAIGCTKRALARRAGCEAGLVPARKERFRVWVL